MVTKNLYHQTAWLYHLPTEKPGISAAWCVCLRSAGLRPWGDMEAEPFLNPGSGCQLLSRPVPRGSSATIPAAGQTLMGSLSLTKMFF